MLHSSLMSFRHLAVLDFEATCDSRSSSSWNIDLQEIIEVPVALVCTEEAEVTARFHAFVRPTRQPSLTPFCKDLTSIQQADVDTAEPIEPVVASLWEWLRAQSADASSTLVVTCGDWDLRTMWPKQVSLCPQLSTPAWFQTWCNLKTVFQHALSKRKPSGMMSMLSALGIPHLGHHHRGADDVENLCNIVIALLHRGVSFSPTWTVVQRQREATRWAKQRDRVEQTLRDREAALLHLPASVGAEVRSRLRQQVDDITTDLQRLQTLHRCFAAD